MTVTALCMQPRAHAPMHPTRNANTPKRKKTRRNNRQVFHIVPRTRLELTRRKPALPPQSSVSTNSTIWASGISLSGTAPAGRLHGLFPKRCANVAIFSVLQKDSAKKAPPTIKLFLLPFPSILRKRVKNMQIGRRVLGSLHGKDYLCTRKRDGGIRCAPAAGCGSTAQV